jgi:two-component system sensor histidine kinase BaeS
MIRSLWVKFLLLLFSVSLISLSASLFLRELITKDFEEYLDGQTEDTIYRVNAAIEGTYEKYSGWNVGALKEAAVWALLLGYKVKIYDTNNHEIVNSRQAVEFLSPLMKRRIVALSGFSGDSSQSDAGSYSSYPLFLAGNNIGSLYIKPVVPRTHPGKETVFMMRSNRFLLLSLLFVGGLSLVMSLIFSKKMTDPIKKLTEAARNISEGNIKSRVFVRGNDEITTLARTFNTMAVNLEVQESLRRKLTANIAHELRTPLTVIQGELEGMIDGLIETDKERLLSLHEEAARLKKIIQGIEDLSKAEACVLYLNKQSFALKPFLTNIKIRFESLFNDKGVSLNLECDEGAMLYADPDKISQIVINFMVNALKATEKGGSVGLGAGTRGNEGYIEVTDTGSGIKKEDVPFIFERFYKTGGGGLGLGLAIAKELTEAHGGRIEVQSEYGKGSKFVLYIPAFTTSS